MRTIEDKAFVLLIVAVSLAFAWILRPFYGAVLWGTVTAILFAPLHRRLLRAASGRRSLAAFFTVLIVIAIVILPLALVGLVAAWWLAGVAAPSSRCRARWGMWAAPSAACIAPANTPSRA